MARAEAAESGTGSSSPTIRVNRGLMFATVALALMMMSIDSTIVATVLHALQSDLHTTVNWAGWTLTAYSLGFMIMLPITGRLGDAYGRRRVFVASVLVFTVSSVLCGFTRNISSLILLRAVQAAGGAGFTPSATGIIVDHFGNSRDRAVGLFGSIFPVGAMIGPIVGGLLVTWLTWRWAFFINLPFGVAILWLTFRVIPADNRSGPSHPARFDFLGMALLGVAIFLNMFAASILAEPRHHLLSPLVVLPALGGLLSLAWFGLHIRRVPEPFIRPQLIVGRGFGAVNLVNMLFGGAMIGAVSLVPLYAANRYGIDPLGAGTLLVTQGIAAVIFSLLGTILLRRSGYRLPILLGGIVCIAGLALLAWGPHWGLSPWLWLAASTFVIGCGVGGANPASRNAGLELAPEHSGTQAALRSLFMQAGTILIISVITSLLAAKAHNGAIQAHAYLTFALLLVPCLVLVRLVPEHRGSW